MRANAPTPHTELPQAFDKEENLLALMQAFQSLSFLLQAEVTRLTQRYHETAQDENDFSTALKQMIGLIPHLTKAQETLYTLRDWRAHERTLWMTQTLGQSKLSLAQKAVCAKWLKKTFSDLMLET